MGEMQNEMETLEVEFAEETGQLKELEEKLGVRSNSLALFIIILFKQTFFFA